MIPESRPPLLRVISGDPSEEELAAIRPDLDGAALMRILDIPPSRVVGEAYDFLLNLRLDRGPMTQEMATEALRAWWAARAASE